MNGYLLSLFFLNGLLLIFKSIFLKSKKFSIILFTYFVLFVFVSISRIDGYEIYSDLRAYLWRFKLSDNAYFNGSYETLTELIRFFWGNSEYYYMLTIAMLILFILIIAYHLLPDDLRKSKGIFFVLYLSYWGLCFSTEVIRSGIAISLSMITFSILIRKNYCGDISKLYLLISLLIYICSLSFHWTQIIILPVLLYLYVDFDFPVRTRKWYLIFIILLTILDFINFSSIITSYFSSTFMNILNVFDKNDHYMIYLSTQKYSKGLSIFSLQYIFFRLVFLFCVFFKDSRAFYNKILNSYLFSFVIFTLLNNFGAITRVMWPLLVLNTFLVYFFSIGNKSSKDFRFISLFMYSGAQIIMTMLYLGARF